MATVTMDLEEGALVRQGGEGLEAVRTAYVSGLGGQPAGRLYAALIASALPRQGDPHPTIPGIVVTELQAEPVDVDRARVTITYGAPAGGNTTPGASAGVVSVEVISDTVSEETQTDQEGNLLWNTYWSWASQSGLPQWEGVFGVLISTRRALKAQVERPRLGVRITQVTTADPKSLVQFLGTLNRERWSGFEPKTWLCSGLNATSNADGTWRVVWEFSYNPKGWQLVDVIEIGGFNPTNVTEGNGIAHHDVYPVLSWTRVPTW